MSISRLEVGMPGDCGQRMSCSKSWVRLLVLERADTLVHTFRDKKQLKRASAQSLGREALANLRSERRGNCRKLSRSLWRLSVKHFHS